MGKIIKPKLNPNGSPVIDFVRFNDWYFSNTFDEILQWGIKHQSSDSKMPIYYAEEWRPKENEIYWFYCFSFNKPGCTVFNSSVIYDDKKRLSLGNCFQTQAEAEDINNILKVLDNMKKYYQEKLNGGGDEKL